MGAEGYVLDGLMLAKRVVEESKTLEEARKRIEYYIDLIVDKKIERIKWELKSLF